MKLIKQSMVLAVVAVVSVALAGGSASAAISPDPYSFGGTDGGAFSTRTALGTSVCDISGVGGRLGGTAGGASGSIATAVLGNCRGIITGATALPPWAVEIDSGAVTVDIAFLTTNALGGSCLYSGTLTGAATSPTSRIVVSSSAVALDTQLSGFCYTSRQLSMVIDTGASISW